MADGKFKVEIPINMKGNASAGKATGVMDKGIKDLNNGIKKLYKTMFLNIDVIEILSSLLGDLFKVLQPLFKILSLLLMVIFLPLMPLVMLLVKGIASLVKLFTGGYGNVPKMIAKILLGIVALIVIYFAAPIVAIIAALVAIVSLFEPIWEGIKWVGGKIADAAIWVWEKIIAAFEFLGGIGRWIWDSIVGGFAALGDFATKIWDVIVGLFKGTISVGVKVWDMFKGFFRGTINVATKVWNWFKGLFSGGAAPEGRATGGSVNAGQAYVVGEQGPELFSPGVSGSIIPNGSMGGNTININNPSVRNDQDIKKIANEVSKVLQRQTKGRFSAG